jgi:hypothetical protein
MPVFAWLAVRDILLALEVTPLTWEALATIAHARPGPRAERRLRLY